MKKRIAAVLLMAALMLSLLPGCSGDGIFGLMNQLGETTSGTTQAATEDTTEPTETEAPDFSELIETAKKQAAQYDYDAAIATLESKADWREYDELVSARKTLLDEKGKLVLWADNTQIPHIFFHSLIADTDRAFDADGEADGYNLYMTTVKEFKTILQQLYDRGYVLVSIYDIAQLKPDGNGGLKMTKGEIYLPADKKPLVMSEDDVNYYEYMTDGDGDGKPDRYGDGFATKLVVGSDGTPTCEYITADGQTVTGEYDLVPILDAFLAEHPDFSYKGAKAILAVTGYQGVFGYRTNPKYKDKLGADVFDQEVETAKKVAQCLKDDGYLIASHSFGHPDCGSISADSLAADTAQWKEQVQPIVGDTDIFIYPFGSDIAGAEDYSGAKFENLYAAGFRYFCNVDASQRAWVQIHGTYVRQARINLDGYRLTHSTGLIDHLVDAASVLDPARPLPVPDM